MSEDKGQKELVQQLLREGIAATRQSDLAGARQAFTQVTHIDPQHEYGWLWRSLVEETSAAAIECLQRVLAINPANERAQKALAHLQADRPVPSAPQPVPAEPALSQAITLDSETESVTVTHFKKRIQTGPLTPPESVNLTEQWLPANLAPKNGEIHSGPPPVNGASKEPVALTHNDDVGHTTPLIAPPQRPRQRNTVIAPCIMIVDDSQTVRGMVRRTLERLGYQILEAQDGFEALAHLANRRPDLILLDITMPRMDGYKVCRLIKENESTRHIPVVMLSGKDGFFDKVKGKLAGAADYITKPFEQSELFLAIQSHLDMG